MFVQELKNYMLELDFKQTDLARFLRVDQKTICRWLRGEAKPTGPTKYVLEALMKEKTHPYDLVILGENSSYPLFPPEDKPI